jgi:cytochrome c biogenesis protein CcdA/glutaredoxin
MLEKYSDRTCCLLIKFVGWGAIFIIISTCFGQPLYAQSIAAPEQKTKIDLYFFYAEDCPNCQAILHGYVPTLQSMYPFLEIKTFDLANPAYYEALAKLEQKYNRRGSELPVIFIGDQMLSGEREVMERLDPLILEYQIKGDFRPPLPPLEIASTSKVYEKTFPVDVVYFYQKGCPKCDRASYLLKYINKKYPHLNVKQIDLNTADGKRLNETLSNRLRIPSDKRLIAPSIFIGEEYLSSEEITESRVEALIQRYSVSESVGKISPPLSMSTDEVKRAEESIIERFKSFGILAILLAGLVEGLNPCALATLIFFISYLTMVGRKRKEIFMAGMGFSASSLVTHLLLGFGILSFIQYLSFFSLFSRVVYLITFIFSLFLGIFSLYDYLQLKKGRPSKMTLQVPNFLKKRIHHIIRARSSEFDRNEETQSARLLIIAIFIGFIVTLLQSTCTSQVYLPTLLFVTNIPSLRESATLYLILYNLIYILPLLAIFGIVYWGVTSEQLSFFLQRRTSTIKLCTALFFFALAGILIIILL